MRGVAAEVVGAPPLRKPVNTLAIVPKSARITSLGRKAYNVLLYEAQEQGLDKDVFRIPLERVVRGVDFDSNDHALIKKHLRAMVSTTVEWQSPTTGEGTAWNVSGLLAHARLAKERGQVWVEWSYAVNLKQELLEPTVFARLKLEVISQLRSHAGIALYEICTRYKDVGRTSRQHWRWWRPVLSGQPESERTAKLEYRIFKRDTLKLAIAEVSSITDLEVELVEHKEGRFISEIQFLIRQKLQSALPLRHPPDAVDLSLVVRARELGVDEDKAEELLLQHGAEAMRGGLGLLAQRAGSEFPGPLRDPYRYLRSLMPSEVARATAVAEAQKAQEEGKARLVAGQAVLREPAREANREGEGASRAEPRGSEGRELQARRQSRWAEEWIRRRREQVAADIAALSAEAQAELAADLLVDMEARQVHPSIRKRLQTSGWQHPLVLPEMLRYFAQGSLGDNWDQPTPQQLLQVAAELGDAG
ncbi:MAG TPA: replication initiation protein [Ideonella sp.]|uniref:replication initiation protein n=1 Tax=Ideonella sp. TaxID=1929293 RepID=UPI002C83981C|nr:replication initiation protein [Ideonella sp.]HSI49700.1 replication initiation protein [Ideonella sp.]